MNLASPFCFHLPRVGISLCHHLPFKLTLKQNKCGTIELFYLRGNYRVEKCFRVRLRQSDRVSFKPFNKMPSFLHLLFLPWEYFTHFPVELTHLTCGEYQKKTDEQSKKRGDIIFYKFSQINTKNLFYSFRHDQFACLPYMGTTRVSSTLSEEVAGVRNDCEPLCGCWVLKLGPLKSNKCS